MSTWERYNEIVIWMLKIAYINLLWIGFTFLGLGLLGFFPATGALFTIVHKWMKKEQIESIFKTFWTTYYKEFISLNIFGLVFMIVGYILVYDLYFIQLNSSNLYLLYPVMTVLSVIYLITFLFFFPVYIQFELKFFQYFKQAFFLAASSILETMIIIIALMILTMIIRFIPGIIPLYTGSIISIVITWCSNRAIKRIKSKKEIRNQ